ncbi:hypothetical protein [Polaribacter sp. M15]
MVVKVEDPHKDRKTKLKEALKGLSYSEASKLLYEFEKELTSELII